MCGHTSVKVLDMKTTNGAAVLLLSVSGNYLPDNKWALSLPADKLAAICASLRAATLALTTETTEQFDEGTAWEVAQPQQGRALAPLRRTAQVIAQQLAGYSGRVGSENAINAAVLAAV